MKNKIHILCPEYVPLENKGEEAIIRGTIDVLYPDKECEYHIVDMHSRKYYRKGNLHVHPGSLFFSDWRSREFRLGFKWECIYSSGCSVVRNGLNRFFPWWITKPHKQARRLRRYLTGEKKAPAKYRDSVEALKNVDYIIAGHDGGLDEYVCHLTNELHRGGIPYGIFGSCMKPGLENKVLLSVFKKTFSGSLFNIARNPIGFEWAETHFPGCRFDLKPDPAFGMKPAGTEAVDALIDRAGLTGFFKKPVVMVTTAEPAPISRHSFDEYSGTPRKVAAHRQFLASLLKRLHEGYDFNILFIPHTIGPDRNMDDRLISRDAVQKAGLENSDRVRVLEDDLSAKELKGLIGRADFLIAERVHSVIGAIGVCTPFMCMASAHDKRVKGILKMQMELDGHIYYLNRPDPDSAIKAFDSLYSRREAVSDKLKTLNGRIADALAVAAQKIHNQLQHERFS